MRSADKAVRLSLLQSQGRPSALNLFCSDYVEWALGPEVLDNGRDALVDLIGSKPVIQIVLHPGIPG